MKFKKTGLRILCVFVVLCCWGQYSQAQPGRQDFLEKKYQEAHDYMDRKDYASAVAIYNDLYPKAAGNNEFYKDYLLCLVAIKDFKTAEKVAKEQLQKFGNNPLYIIALGNVYKYQKKDRDANEKYALALTYINGDDILTQQIASAFAANNDDEWTIKTYERAVTITQSPGLYSAPLARLYNKSGDVDKAIKITIESYQTMPQMRGDETIQSTLLEIIGNDPEKQKKAQKAIVKLTNEQPENYLYTYLLTWIFSVQNNWDLALIQIQALEKRNVDKGQLLLNFALNAAQKDEFEVAAKAYNTIVNYGNTNPRYRLAKEGLLHMKLMKIQSDVATTKEEITGLSEQFKAFTTEYPDAFGKEIINDYALLEAKYADNIDNAVALLEKAVALKIGHKEFIANCKLQLGDYYIITEKVWDAALMYAQVDKSFREDALGEEARFRNAKLSYYQNDFEQAQGQLSVLKASTSELIANDALYLSVLITENIPADSNLIPLQRFAYADLLLFQNKDAAAESLLDSVSNAFPKNALADDILLLRSKIAIKHKDFIKAIDYLKQIIEGHSKDVLADDALFQIAEIHNKILKNSEQAQRYYEQLIIDYPGSSFVQQARAALKK